MQQEERIFNPKSIDPSFIKGKVNEGRLVIVQFGDNSYTSDMLAELNQLAKELSKDFAIRFFGHYNSYFDCEILLQIPYVKHLQIDCLDDVKNITCVKELKHLEKLSVGIFELKETELLAFDNLQHLISLSIGPTRTKKLDLSYLIKYQSLKELYIADQNKNIEAIRKLKNLESLIIYGLKKTSISFINELHSLKKLSLLLGGRDNLSEITSNIIEELEVIRVRGFNSFENLSNFSHLKSLTIEDNIQLKSLQFNASFNSLQHLRIVNCKSLNELKGLENLPSLETVTIYQTALDFDNVFNQRNSSNLKYFGFYTLKKSSDKIIKAKIQSAGYECR